jgi:acetyl-CoA C-acetyltransferase
MRNVLITGAGQTDVAEHWDEDLRHLGYYALRDALEESGVARVDGLFVGNMLAGEITRQEQVGALVADFAGLRGVEAVRAEAAGASGAAALRLGFLAVASGAMDVAIVLGVEKFSDQAGGEITAALGTSLDADFEGSQGLTATAAAALLMRRYMHQYSARLEDFAPFSVNAHANAATNPHAMYHNRVTAESYRRAPMVATPVNLFDQAPLGDGAAAVVLVAEELARDLPPRKAGGTEGGPRIRIAASAAATDALALHDRRDLLYFEAAYNAAVRAYEMAGIGPSDVDVFETYDACSIFSVLTLEACGFARRGEGLELGHNGSIALPGAIPVSTFGGLKARGDAGGATGVYQIVELVQQLRGAAGDNQVPHARWGMGLSLGGAAATAVVHVLTTIEP